MPSAAVSCVRRRISPAAGSSCTTHLIDMLGRRSFSTTVAVLKKGGPPKNNKDPMDISQMGSEFDFPLTRPTILKQELRRDFLHYLRLEQKQFGELGESEASCVVLPSGEQALTRELSACDSRFPQEVLETRCFTSHQSATPALSRRGAPRSSKGRRLVQGRLFTSFVGIE